MKLEYFAEKVYANFSSKKGTSVTLEKLLGLLTVRVCQDFRNTPLLFSVFLVTECCHIFLVAIA